MTDFADNGVVRVDDKHEALKETTNTFSADVAEQREAIEELDRKTKEMLDNLKRQQVATRHKAVHARKLDGIRQQVKALEQEQLKAKGDDEKLELLSLEAKLLEAELDHEKV